MSVNLNPGLFPQNFQVKNNAVKQAPSASLKTPLAGDTVSFKKAENKVGFGKFFKPVSYGVEAVERIVIEIETALVKPTVDNLSSVVAKLNGVKSGQLAPHISRLENAVNNTPSNGLNRAFKAKLRKLVKTEKELTTASA